MGKEKLEGKLEIFYETGMDGMAMAFNHNPLSKRIEDLHFLKKGDYLEVYEDKKIYWEGIIDKEKSELYSKWNKTGSRDKKWNKMFKDEMEAILYVGGKDKK